jgi:tRNA(Ile)-lysidine synthetase-like protein
VVRLEGGRAEGFGSHGSLAVELASDRNVALFDSVKFTWRFVIRKGIGRPKGKGGCEFFDADRVGSPIILRHWQPGDRFQPIGMRSAQKLQDIFTNEKVPRNKRHDVIVALAASGEIFWVEGLRISERFKITDGTVRCLEWRWERL